MVSQIGPQIQESSTPETVYAFYSLAHTLLHRNWSFFWQFSHFSEPYKPNSPETRAVFSELLQLVLKPLHWRDLSPFHLNITFIQELEHARGIFGRIFSVQENYSLTAVLLQVLVHRTHQLYVENILDVLWCICNVDAKLFYDDYVHGILQSAGLLTVDQKETLRENLLQCYAQLQTSSPRQPGPLRVDYMSFCTHILDFTRDFIVFSESNT